MTKQPKLPLRVRRLQDLTRKIERLEKRREVAISMLVRVETTLPKLRAQRKRLSSLLLADQVGATLAGRDAAAEVAAAVAAPVESLPPPITPEAVRKAKMKAMGFRETKRRPRPSRPSAAERRPD